MAVVTPWIDIAFVDAYTDDPVWQAATDDAKNASIVNATNYFVANYTCPNVDYTDTPDDVNNATAELAVLDINGKLYPTEGSSQIEYLTRKTTKVGTVEVTKEWNPAQQSFDATMKKINDMLSGTCYLSTGTKGLIRV